MKVTFTQTIDAKLVVTARLGADGEFSAVVAAFCPYGEDQIDGAACSAQIDVPQAVAQQMREAMEAARQSVLEDLGAKLAKSKAMAERIAFEQRELA